jgi:uncharacterized protein
MSQPLSENELDRLDDMLEQHAMNLEMLDGFIAAVVVGPVEIPEGEWLREIWGDKTAEVSTQKELTSFVTRHRNAIARLLQSGDVYTPLLLEDEQGKYTANDWAIGFTRGMELRKQEWASLLDDDDHGGSLVPILALAYEHDPDPEMRPYDKPISDEAREKLIVGATAGVMRIFAYFQAQRLLGPHAFDEGTTYRRGSPKVGRNDPCPCGSGKKFKQCCGRITLH